MVKEPSSVSPTTTTPLTAALDALAKIADCIIGSLLLLFAFVEFANAVKKLFPRFKNVFGVDIVVAPPARGEVMIVEALLLLLLLLVKTAVFTTCAG